jgi:hypothetical protein
MVAFFKDLLRRGFQDKRTVHRPICVFRLACFTGTGRVTQNNLRDVCNPAFILPAVAERRQPVVEAAIIVV